MKLVPVSFMIGIITAIIFEQKPDKYLKRINHEKSKGNLGVTQAILVNMILFPDHLS